jgi:ABC-type multidrug transport system fused ATPase/permease subunit
LKVKNNILPVLIDLWGHFSKKRKIQLIILLLLMFITSLTEVVSLGAILPFLSVLSNPDWLYNHYVGKFISKIFHLTLAKQLIFLITIFFISAIVVSALMRLLLLWTQTKVSYAIGSDLSYTVYNNILYQPYEELILKNSSDIISAIGKSKALVWTIIVPVLSIISSILMLLMILITIFFINTEVAVISIISFALFYFIIINISKKTINASSKIIDKESSLVIKALQEGMGGIRDIIIDGTHSTYSKIYLSADTPSRKAQANLSFIGIAPRYGIEAFGMILISILAYNLTNNKDGLISVIPILGSLTLAAQRMMPLLQQIFTNWTTLKGGQETLKTVLEYLNIYIPNFNKIKVKEKLKFNKSVQLKNINYRYNKNSSLVLKDINLTIVKGSKIGVMGTTGSGKSTLIDIIMGLLIPQSGEILIDDIKVNENNRRHWQKNIAHVPQSIFLTDGTISENIAFGIESENIDMKRIEIAAENAQLKETINSMESGFNTIVGERGIRLSGGQRQRIGIARALYKNADIIIFDEATSALDNETEKEVMRSINSIGNNITIIIIAHRLSTLENCDQIIHLDEKNQSFNLLNYKDLKQAK